MVQPGIRADNLKELRRELRQVKDKELDAELKALHKAISDEILDRALPRVPVLTGALKASVRGSGTISAAVGRVGKKRVPYAAAIHWGWPKRNIKATPFLTDAAEELEKDITDRYDEAVSQMLDRVIRTRRGV